MVSNPKITREVWDFMFFLFCFLIPIDMAKEVVNLESTEQINVHTLGSQVPDDHGRYHLFRFPHSHEGDFLESIGKSCI